MNQVDILIADDEPHIVRALSFIFQREGLKVEMASDGEEAVDKFRQFAPRIIFLDMIMPRMDGVTACRTIKDDASVPAPYVIFLTCKGQDTDRENCLKAGADDFINKPFSPRDVLEKVRSLLRTA